LASYIQRQRSFVGLGDGVRGRAPRRRLLTRTAQLSARAAKASTEAGSVTSRAIASPPISPASASSRSSRRAPARTWKPSPARAPRRGGADPTRSSGDDRGSCSFAGGEAYAPEAGGPAAGSPPSRSPPCRREARLGRPRAARRGELAGVGVVEHAVEVGVGAVDLDQSASPGRPSRRLPRRRRSWGMRTGEAIAIRASPAASRSRRIVLLSATRRSTNSSSPILIGLPFAARAVGWRGSIRGCGWPRSPIARGVAGRCWRRRSCAASPRGGVGGGDDAGVGDVIDGGRCRFRLAARPGRCVRTAGGHRRGSAGRRPLIPSSQPGRGRSSADSMIVGRTIVIRADVSVSRPFAERLAERVGVWPALGEGASPAPAARSSSSSHRPAQLLGPLAGVEGPSRIAASRPRGLGEAGGGADRPATAARAPPAPPAPLPKSRSGVERRDRVMGEARPRRPCRCAGRRRRRWETWTKWGGRSRPGAGRARRLAGPERVEGQGLVERLLEGDRRGAVDDGVDSRPVSRPRPRSRR